VPHIRALRLILVLAVFAAGCGLRHDVKGPPHADLHGSTSGLVSAFNADKGKVRAIFIASPT
jgi:hypothetical protein